MKNNQEIGVKIQVDIIKMLRFADDIVTFRKTENELEDILNNMNS